MIPFWKLISKKHIWMNTVFFLIVNFFRWITSNMKHKISKQYRKLWTPCVAVYRIKKLRSETEITIRTVVCLRIINNVQYFFYEFIYETSTLYVHRVKNVSLPLVRDKIDKLRKINIISKRSSNNRDQGTLTCTNDTQIYTCLRICSRTFSKAEGL